MRKVTIDQTGDIWHRWRHLGVGGSEAATVCGLSPYDSPMDLYAAKTLPAPPAGKAENPHMARGRREEPNARRQYEQLMGWSAAPVCVLHDDHDYLRCSLDGLSPDDAIVLEIKSPGQRNHDKVIEIAEASNQRAAWHELLPYWYCQVQYQLYVTGCRDAHFVSWCPSAYQCGRQFVLVPVEVEAEFQTWMIEKVKAFWQHVVTETPLPADF